MFRWSALRSLRSASPAVDKDYADTLGSSIDGAPQAPDRQSPPLLCEPVITARFGAGRASRPSWRTGTWAPGMGTTSTLSANRVPGDRFTATVDGIPRRQVRHDGCYNFLPYEVAAAFGLEQRRDRPRSAGACPELRCGDRLFRLLRWFVLPATGRGRSKRLVAVPLVVRDGATVYARDLQLHFEAAGIRRGRYSPVILRHDGFATLFAGSPGRVPPPMRSCARNPARCQQA